MNFVFPLMEHLIYVYIHNKQKFDNRLNHWRINSMQRDIHYDDEIQIEIFLKHEKYQWMKIVCRTVGFEMIFKDKKIFSSTMLLHYNDFYGFRIEINIGWSTEINQCHLTMIIISIDLKIHRSIRFSLKIIFLLLLDFAVELF